MTLSNRLIKLIIFIQILIIIIPSNFFNRSSAVFTNDATILGVLILILAGIFYAEKSPNIYLKKFFKYVQVFYYVILFHLFLIALE